MAARPQPAGPLPLRELPAPLRALVRLPRLRRPLHDRPHVVDARREVPQLWRVDDPADLAPRCVDLTAHARSNQHSEAKARRPAPKPARSYRTFTVAFAYARAPRSSVTRTVRYFVPALNACFSVDVVPLDTSMAPSPSRSHEKSTMRPS